GDALAVETHRGLAPYLARERTRFPPRQRIQVPREDLQVAKLDRPAASCEVERSGSADAALPERHARLAKVELPGVGGAVYRGVELYGDRQRSGLQQLSRQAHRRRRLVDGVVRAPVAEIDTLQREGGRFSWRRPDGNASLLEGDASHVDDPGERPLLLVLLRRFAGGERAAQRRRLLAVRV